MKIQIALDTLDPAGCLEIVDKIHESIDIVEIGTPILLEYGMEPLERVKAKHPNLMYLADTKIMDAGFLEAENAFKKGADIITVLGVTNNATVEGALEAAKKYGKEVMIDMIEVKDIKARAKELEAMGVHYLCVHTAFDVQVQGLDPLDELEELVSVLTKSKACVAGGVKLAILDKVIALDPEVVVVGGGITSQTDPAAVAKEFREMMGEDR